MQARAETVTKFAFAREFDSRRDDRRTAERRAAPDMDVTRQIEDRIRTEAFEAGRSAGRAEASADTDAAIARLGNQLTEAMSQADKALAALHADAAQLAVAIADHIKPSDESMAVRLEHLLADAQAAPHIRITVPENMAAAAEQAAAIAAARSDCAARISIETAPALTTGDLVVDWGTGGLMDTRAARLASIRAALAEQINMEPTHG